MRDPLQINNSSVDAINLTNKILKLIIHSKLIGLIVKVEFKFLNPWLQQFRKRVINKIKHFQI